ncbi:DUF4145 domain-containing protein [Sorangium sp. So ce448]|uniref:DUF4145 domain-containing protein n=1 Tax=Sorangium sp. So ce448 TaxID=3133314 RepID=UPI003F5FA1F1
MICPKCNIAIRFEPSNTGPVHADSSDAKRQTGYDVAEGFCPECHQFIVLLRHGKYYQHDFNDDGARDLTPESIKIIYPPVRNTRPLPPEVPKPYRSDFDEAAAVLDISPKASAAISRRILQHVLREELGITRRSLEREIDEFIARNDVPSTLKQAVDAVRTVGNFAAHPMKSTSIGEVLEVEPGEAAWLLDVLEALFDFVFVQPKRLDDKKAALNAKLASAGKPPLK